MTKLKKNGVYIIAILAMIICIAIICPVAMQNDVFWSIKVGEKLVHEGIWEIDTFSIHEGLTYVAHHFCTDILIYLVYSIGNITGLYIFEIVMALVLAGLLFMLNKELCRNNKLAYCFLAVQMLLLKPYIAVRAQMLSYMIFVIELILLEKSRKKGSLKYYIPLALLPIVLANFHMGVIPFYFIILGVYGLECLNLKLLWIKPNVNVDYTRFKKLIVCGIIGVLVIFINPYGVDGVLYSFKTIGNEFINQNISEFAPFAMANELHALLIIYIFFMMLIFMLNKEKVLLKDMLLIFGTLFMNFMAYRYSSLFIICSAVVVQYIYNVIKSLKIDELDKKSFVVTLIIVLGVIGIELSEGKDASFYTDLVAPVKAVEFLKENINEDTILYNEYEWGGYLMLHNIKVFIDSRCDLYTEDYNEGVTVAEDYMKINMLKTGYKEAMEKYNINTYLVRTDTLIYGVLVDDERFKEVYSDDEATIFVKTIAE